MNKRNNNKLGVPIHSLGISQIIAFGLLFYVFAQLKIPIAARVGVSESEVLIAVSGALLLQVFLAPVVGSWIDRFGALYVMSRGMVIGAIGMAILPLFPSIYWVWFCMLPIGFGHAMSTYESAFAAVIQMDERRSRRNISFISFYGGVASSLTWLTVAPLYGNFGLPVTCGVLAAILLLMALRIHWIGRLHTPAAKKKTSPEPFKWSILNKGERLSIVVLAIASSVHYFVFSSSALLFITWFDLHFNDFLLAAFLASIYGPFQVVGRCLEMVLGSRYDARITGLCAYFCVVMAMLSIQVTVLPMAVLAMVFFGIGNGILTVTFGFVTNMFFRAGVYGRAKGRIVSLRAFGTAVGPSMGGLIFASAQEWFFAVMVGLSILSALVFSTLLLLKPENMDNLD